MFYYKYSFMTGWVYNICMCGAEDTPLAKSACSSRTCQNGGHCELLTQPPPADGGTVAGARCNCDMTSFVGTHCTEGTYVTTSD